MRRERASVIDKKTERELLSKCKHDKSAMDKLVLANLGLVGMQAGKYIHLDNFEDLFNVGVEGLIYAISKFDLERENHLGVFAGNWIHQKIIRYIHNRSRMIRLPVNMCEDLRKYYAIKDSYFKKYGDYPDKEYIAKKMQIKIKKLDRLIDLEDKTSITSLNHINNDGSEMMGCIGEDEDLDQLERTINVKVLIENLIDLLKGRDREITIRAFGLFNNAEESITEIAESMGITRQAVSLRKIKSLKIMKAYMDRNNLSITDL